MTRRSSLDLRALIGAICVGIAAFAPGAIAQPASNGGFEVPTRSLPVPETVSPQVQKLIAAPLRPGWDVLPKTGEEWKPVSEAGAAGTIKGLPGLTERPEGEGREDHHGRCAGLCGDSAGGLAAE